MATGRTSVVKSRHSISASDAADLRWFFKSGGLDQFSESTFGIQLERAHLFAVGVRKCPRCKGRGFVASKKDWREPSRTEALLLKWENSPRKRLPPVLDRQCPKCECSGWVMRARNYGRGGPVTVRPTGSSKSGSTGASIDPGDANIARLGSVTGRLAAVERHGSVFREALEAFYSPGGGALGLWALVPAGKTLLKRNGQRLPPRQFFENERQDAQAKHDKQRVALFETADAQADELLSLAHGIWNTTAPVARVKLQGVA